MDPEIVLSRAPAFGRPSIVESCWSPEVASNRSALNASNDDDVMANVVFLLARTKQPGCEWYPLHFSPPFFFYFFSWVSLWDVPDGVGDIYELA